MRAAVFTGPGRIQVERVPIPEPAAGEVRVRLEGSGVCASNLLPWEGAPWVEYPLAAGAPGHEGWGAIDALGEGVDDVALGDRVAVLSYRAYAEYDIAPAEWVVPVPEALRERPVPAEPLGCAVNVFRRSAIEAGQTVAIIGIGFMGALLTRLVANAGARTIAISRRPFSLEMARAFGADEAIPMDDHRRIIARVQALTDG